MSKEIVSDAQIIGIDCGRGYVKAYSIVNGKEYKTLFKSIIGDGKRYRPE